MPAPQTEVIITVAGVEYGRHVVEPGDFVIGRKEDCHIRVDADLVSQQHANLIINYDNALIEDLGGGNGTFVNDAPVTERTRLWPSQKIRIGAATVTLRRLQGEAPTDMSLAPAQAAIRRMLPAEMLREKKYDIGAVVARGGMGAILDAREAAIERQVAMKVMLDTNDPDAVERFIAEAKVTGQLEHPNVVPVHELGVDENGQPFYTMKMVKGVTLKKVLEQMAGERSQESEVRSQAPVSESSLTSDSRPLTSSSYTLPALLTIFQKVCDALAFAHAKGVIHRDLKPENVMVGEFGEALVMDWGLAKILDPARVAEPTGPAQEMRSMVRKPAADGDTGSQTISGTVMGTPQYMAPEQAAGRIEEMDARSDIFSLGGILYTILTLRPPVEGKTLDEVLQKVRNGDITAPSFFGASTGQGEPSAKGEVLEAKKIKPLPHCPGGRVPAALSAVVMKALSLRREDRYQTVAEFSADITAYQTGFATKAEHASFMKQIVLLIRRNKGIFVTGFVAWLLITALAVWFIIHLRASERETRRQAEIAQQNERKAVASEALAVQEKEAARHSLARAALNLAEAAQREGDGSEMQAALNDVPDDLRDSTWRYLLAQSDTSIARLRLGASGLVAVVPHPRQPGVFAVANADSEIAIVEARTGTALLKFKPTFPPGASGAMKLAFSPDGERIAIGRNGPGGIVIHSARDGTKLLDWTAEASAKIEFSPDGRLLLQLQANQLRVWDATSGQAVCVFPPEPTGSNMSAIFTPDSQHLLVADYNSKAGMPLIRARDGTVERTLPRSRFTVRAMAMSPDGHAVKVGDGGGVTIFDWQDGRVISEFQFGDRRIDQFAITAGGERIVTAVALPDGRQEIRVWDAAKGRAVQALLGGSGGISAFSVHPLSGELVVTGANSRVWDLTGKPARWIMQGGNHGTAFFGSEDLLFAGINSGTFGLLHLEAGKPAVVWRSPEATQYRMSSVSADGRVAAAASFNGAAPILMLRKSDSGVEQFAAFPHKYSMQSMSLSPTGDRLAVIASGGGVAAMYDTATGQQPVKLEQKDVKKRWSFGWLDGGRLLGLVTAKAERGTDGSEEWIVVWDAATGKVLQTATHRTAMDVLAIAPDGRHFAEAGTDKKLRIRDAATLAVQQEFRAHDGAITALAWHPTLPIVASTSEDLSVRLWNIETGERLEEFRGPVFTPVALAFSPGGQRLACAVENRTTHVWEPDSLNPKSKADPAKAADAWEDLLAPLTPPIVTQTGNGWRMEGGALFSPGKSCATLPLPGNFAATSYQVRVKLRQLAAKNVFHLELPVADRMVGFDLDGSPQDGFYTGLLRVNGTFGKNLPGSVHGKQVKDSEQHELEVTVQLYETSAKITATLDGQPLYEWAGPPTALSQHEKWITSPGTLALGTIAADWVVYEVKVKRVEK